MSAPYRTLHDRNALVVELTPSVLLRIIPMLHHVSFTAETREGNELFIPFGGVALPDEVRVLPEPSGGYWRIWVVGSIGFRITAEQAAVVGDYMRSLPIQEVAA